MTNESMFKVPVACHNVKCTNDSLSRTNRFEQFTYICIVTEQRVPSYKNSGVHGILPMT